MRDTYNLKVFGKVNPVTKNQFLGFLLLFFVYLTLANVGIYLLGDIYALLGVFLLSSSLEMKGKTYAILQHDRVRNFVGQASMLVGFGYLFYYSFT